MEFSSMGTRPLGGHSASPGPEHSWGRGQGQRLVSTSCLLHTHSMSSKSAPDTPSAPGHHQPSGEGVGELWRAGHPRGWPHGPPTWPGTGPGVCVCPRQQGAAQGGCTGEARTSRPASEFTLHSRAQAPPSVSGQGTTPDCWPQRPSCEPPLNSLCLPAPHSVLWQVLGLF